MIKSGWRPLMISALRFPLEFGRGIGLLRFHHIDHVMAHPLPIRLRRLGRADVHAPVNLHAVHGEDRSIQSPRPMRRAISLFPAAVGPRMANESGQTGCPIR